MKIQGIRAFGLLRRDVRLYLVSLAISLLSGGIRAVLLNLLLLRLGYGPEFVGLIGGVGALVYAAACLASGVLATWLGTRRMILLGLGMGTLGLMMTGSAQWVPTALRSGWLMAATVAVSAAFAMSYSNGIPFIVRATLAGERDYALALRSSLRPLTGFLGGAIGGFLPTAIGGLLARPLTHPQPYSLAFLVAGLASVPALAVMLASGAGRTWDAAARATRTSPSPVVILGVISVFSLLHMGGQSSATTFFNIYLDREHGISTAQIGVLLALSKLAAAPAAMAFPALARWLGAYKTVLLTTLGTAASLMLSALVPHWTAAGLGLLGSEALGVVVITASVAYSQQLVPAEWQSVMSGCLTMGLGLGVTVAALVGGYLIPAVGYRPLFGAGALAAAAAAALFWAFFRVPRGQLIGQTTEPVPATGSAEPAGK